MQNTQPRKDAARAHSLSYKTILAIFLCCLCACFYAACQRSAQGQPDTPQGRLFSLTKQLSPATAQTQNASILLQIQDQSFTLTLYDTKPASALRERLPFSLHMHELNGNEKYAALPQALPAKDVVIKKVNAGDVMLYQTDTLVIFYESPITSYQYTPIGKIEETFLLKEALGKGEIEVKFTAQP